MILFVRLIGIMVCVATLFARTSACHAGLVITMDNISMTAGSSATMDVWVTGDVGNTDLLDYFIATFRIVPLGVATAEGVRFVSPQTNEFELDSGYVFLNNSVGVVREVDMFNYQDDTLEIIDSTPDFSGVDVNPMSFLLARLELSTAVGVLEGSVHQVDLVIDESQFQNPVIGDITFATSGGIISVAGTAAVPEPSSMALMGTGIIAMMGHRRRRLR